MTSAKELKEIASELNVLYAEDEAILREDMQSTFSKLFKNAYAARNGQEAFEIFKKEKVDLVITDINMPIMDGIDLIHSIKKHEDSETMVTVLSAHNESKLLVKLINMGINSFINKPVDKQNLIEVLYKSCKIITDRKLLIEYELQLEKELAIVERKNNVLEQKLNQLALERNKNVKRETKGVLKVDEKKDSKEVNYFETLLLDDKDELRDLSLELDNFIAMLFQAGDLNENYLSKLSHVYGKYASVINTYPEFYDISISLQNFSQSLLRLETKFMENINQTGIYFESLQMTLENYRENIWNQEAKNPRFYNASLTMDIQLIIDYLEGKEAEDNDIEFF